MERPSTTLKVVFLFVAIVLMVATTLVLSQQSAGAAIGFSTRSALGLPIFVRSNPQISSRIMRLLPNGYPITVICSAKDSYNHSWLQLADKNYIEQSYTTVPQNDQTVPSCNETRVYADRTLVKSSGSTVYIIQSGMILLVPNEETLVGCLGGWSKVMPITDIELSNILTTYPNGGTASCPVSYPDRTTLLAPGETGVYVISNRSIYVVPNPETLNACLGGWPQVKNIGKAEMKWALASYSYAGGYVCPYEVPNGSKMYAPGGGVYVILNGQSYGVPSPEFLTSCLGGWSGVRATTQYEINLMLTKYPYSGAAPCMFSLVNGSKLQAPNGTVFIVSNGMTYGMPNAETLTVCYGGWSDVRIASQNEINLMLSKYPYAGAAGCALPNVGLREQRAVDWARSQLGSTYWNGWCELMVEQAYNTNRQFLTAAIHANYEIAIGAMHTDSNAPAGALAYFGPASVNGYNGHIMISIGGGQFISNGYTWNGRTYGARITTISGVGAGPYLGWAYADSGWPGR